MQGQEQQTSSASSSSHSRSHNLVQLAEIVENHRLSPAVIETLATSEFSGVDISGAMQLTDISNLSDSYWIATLTQSIELENKPFTTEGAQQFLSALRAIKPEMPENDFRDNIAIIAGTAVRTDLPKYFHTICRNLVEQCVVMQENPTFNGIAQRNESNTRLTVCSNFIDQLSQINDECLEFERRFRIIQSIQDIRSNVQDVLTIPIEYHYDLPVYLYLLTERRERSAIELVSDRPNTQIYRNSAQAI